MELILTKPPRPLTTAERRNILQNSLSRVDPAKMESSTTKIEICRNCHQRAVVHNGDRYCPNCLSIEARKAEANEINRKLRLYYFRTLTVAVVILFIISWLLKGVK